MRSSHCASNECVEIDVWGKSSFSVNGDCVEVGSAVKSSFSASGNCVEAEGKNKSSFSQVMSCVETEGAISSSFSGANGQCVEAERTQHVVAVRDTKDRSIEPVVFSLWAWQEFINEVKAGEYPLASGIRGVLRRALRCDFYSIGHLVFNRAEWDAFVKGVQNLDENGRGEFDLSPALEAELASA